MYIVFFRDNYNQEFDINGFKIMTNKEFDEFEETALDISWSFNYEANNESLSYHNGEDFLSRFTLKEISKSEATIIKSLFGDEYGTFINIDFLKIVINGQYDDDDGIYDDFDNDYDA